MADLAAAVGAAESGAWAAEVGRAAAVGAGVRAAELGWAAAVGAVESGARAVRSWWQPRRN
jgi:hypothetical protein